ncbi:hypothetical protein [Siphovirus 29632]|nr:hypothetical protein [Siphovirus 29632]
MVVIDAEKHYLNYKQSERDNGIAALRKKYQGENGHGAATLISRAKGPVFIEEGHDPEGGFRVRARSRCPPLDGCY